MRRFVVRTGNFGTNGFAGPTNHLIRAHWFTVKDGRLFFFATESDDSCCAVFNSWASVVAEE